jgi:uncharacterized protein YjbJ (UPF0337 family)
MSHSEQTPPLLSPNMRGANGIVNKELIMIKPGTQDQVEGELHDVKGKVKEVAGRITNDPDLEADGDAEEIAGKIQKKIGQVKKVLGK